MMCQEVFLPWENLFFHPIVKKVLPKQNGLFQNEAQNSAKNEEQKHAVR